MNKLINGSINKARYLRRNQTEAERLLWNELRNRKCCGLKFRRQVPIESYVADFACVERRLIIELDGYMHSWNKKKDRYRDNTLIKKGFKILRFHNRQVKHSMKYILDSIAVTAGIPLLVSCEASSPLHLRERDRVRVHKARRT